MSFQKEHCIRCRGDLFSSTIYYLASSKLIEFLSLLRSFCLRVPVETVTFNSIVLTMYICQIIMVPGFHVTMRYFYSIFCLLIEHLKEIVHTFLLKLNHCSPSSLMVLAVCFAASLVVTPSTNTSYGSYTTVF